MVLDAIERQLTQLRSVHGRFQRYEIVLHPEGALLLRDEVNAARMAEGYVKPPFASIESVGSTPVIVDARMQPHEVLLAPAGMWAAHDEVEVPDGTE